MPVLLNVANFSSLNILERAKLGADVAKGSMTINIENPQKVAVNSFLILGALGSELSELVQVSAISGNTATLLNATGLAHVRFEDVTVIFGNQLRVYRAVNTTGKPPADASFSLVGPIALDVDQQSTPFTDATGDPSMWYKAVFYNTVTTLQTALADSVAGRMPTSGYCSVDEIRAEAGFKNATYIGDDVVDQKRQAATAQVNSALSGLYSLPLSLPVDPHIKQITIQIAAGLLMNAEYGLYGRGTDQGNAKLAWAEAELDKFKSKELVILNPDGSDSSLPGAGSGGASGWPNNTTAVLGPNNGGDNGPRFTGGMRF